MREIQSQRFATAAVDVLCVVFLGLRTRSAMLLVAAAAFLRMRMNGQRNWTNGAREGQAGGVCCREECVSSLSEWFWAVGGWLPAVGSTLSVSLTGFGMSPTEACRQLQIPPAPPLAFGFQTFTSLL